MGIGRALGPRALRVVVVAAIELVVGALVILLVLESGKARAADRPRVVGAQNKQQYRRQFPLHADR